MRDERLARALKEGDGTSAGWSWSGRECFVIPSGRTRPSRASPASRTHPRSPSTLAILSSAFLLHFGPTCVLCVHGPYLRPIIAHELALAPTLIGMPGAALAPGPPDVHPMNFE